MAIYQTTESKAIPEICFKNLKKDYVMLRYVRLRYVTLLINLACGRQGDLVVSTLYSGSNGPGVNPGRGHCDMFLGETLLKELVLTQVYKWTPVNLTLGVTLR